MSNWPLIQFGGISALTAVLLIDIPDMMERSGLSLFLLNLHTRVASIKIKNTTEEDSYIVLSEDVKTFCDPTVTQHDPLLL